MRLLLKGLSCLVPTVPPLLLAAAARPLAPLPLLLN